MALPSLGIDVSKKKLDLALLVDGKLKHKTCENTHDGFNVMLEWLKRQKVERVHAVFEATGGYEESAATALADAGHLVSIQNPALIAKFAQSLNVRSKTDKLDSSSIAHYAERMREDLRLWSPPPVELRELKDLVNRRQALVEMRTQELNRLEMAKERSVRQSIQSHLAFLNDQIEKLEEQIRDHIDRHPGLKSQQELLQSIPGVGQGTAALFLAEVGGVIAQMTHAKQLVAYCGLNVRHHESGSSVRGRPRMSKFGNRKARTSLYMPAMSAIRYNPVIKALNDRLKTAGKPFKVCMGAAMRKLVHIIFGVLKHQTPFNANLA